MLLCLRFFEAVTCCHLATVDRPCLHSLIAVCINGVLCSADWQVIASLTPMSCRRGGDTNYLGTLPRAAANNVPQFRHSPVGAGRGRARCPLLPVPCARTILGCLHHLHISVSPTCSYSNSTRSMPKCRNEPISKFLSDFKI